MDASKQLIHEFLCVIFKGHTKSKGYKNVKRFCEEHNIDRRTYYHWVNGEAVPRLSFMIDELSKKGYHLKIEPMSNFYE